MYRARFPKSHTWTPDTELMSAILYVLQWANWQRGGGKGDKPELVERPEDDQPSRVEIPLASIQDRKAAFEAEMKRREEAAANRTMQTRMEVVA